MAYPKVRSEAGIGGKLGHSNMSHYTYTEEIKQAARIRRRRDAKRTADEGVQDYGEGWCARDDKWQMKNDK